MKVKRKNVYIREDCLSVFERGDEVTLTAYRNIIQIHAQDRHGKQLILEVSVADLTDCLLNYFK